MRDRDLNAAIAAANPVRRERAAALTLPADRAALLDALAAEPPPGRAAPARGHLRALTPLVVLLAFVAVAGLFTAPGRAVSSWVGDRLGFGEPGGPPSLRQLNESWSKGSSLEGQRQYVLIVGPVPGQDRSRYEFITYYPAPRADRPSRPRGPCFKLDLTQVRSMSAQGCGTLPKGGQFAYTGVGGGYGQAYRDKGDLRFSDELFHVSGRVGPKVGSVEATVDGRPIPVQVRPVPESLRERFDLGGPFSFFIGFFSGVPRGGTLAVTARGIGGEPLGRARTELGDNVLAVKMRCRMMLNDAPRLPRAGLEECRQVLGRGGR